MYPKNRRTNRVIGLLLIFALLLLVYPTSAQGPEITATSSSVKVVGEADSINADKGKQLAPVDPSAEPAPVPLESVVGQDKSLSTASSASSDDKLVSVIVKLDHDPLASYEGGVAGLPATSIKATGADKLDLSSAASQQYLAYVDGVQSAFAKDASALGAQVVNRYDVVFGGVSMLVPESQVKALSGMSGVVAVFEDVMKQPDTERSPRFIGATRLWKELGGKKDAGEGVVVGVVDTGIWPEHPSFSDPDPAGEAYAAPPATWVGTNCDFGSAVPGDVPFACNNKLVGATWSMATYAGSGLLLPTEFLSARDDNGHGSHTTSTAAGNHSVDASIFGIPRGTISGIAPRAHVAMYKACGDLGCFTSDLVSAINAAVADGVDVINYSIGGGPSDPYSDPDSLAFLAAYDAGVFVATSAGNSGPGANTVGSPGDAPWITTVGASTSDRHFISTITLTSSTAGPLVVTGASVTGGFGPVPIELAGGSGQCTAGMPPVTPGAIVVCDRGGFARVTKSFNAMNAGAGGMILRNLALQGLATDNHYIPSVHVEFDVGQSIVDYINNESGVMASFTPGVATKVKGDVMAAFSSRGGVNYLTIKPDVTAPGVQILAANTPLGATQGPGGFGPFGELFQAIQGTSMSSPHTAGAGALLMDLYPGWTAGQVRSALMTTAKTRKVFKEDGTTKADWFDMGAGRIDLRKAWDPGITFDETAAGFLANQGQEWHNNIPSLWHPSLPGALTVWRTAADVLGFDNHWTLTTKTDSKNWWIEVPETLFVPANGTATFPITIHAGSVPQGEVHQGVINLSDGFGYLHIPVAFQRGQASVTINKECAPDVIKRNKEASHCTITVENTSTSDANVNLVDEIPWGLDLDPGSVQGADVVAHNTVGFNDTLFGAGAPVVQIQPDDIGGYFPLSTFFAPAGCPSNCDDGAFIVSGLNIQYLGQTYTDGIWSVNGTLELGTASGVATSFANQNLPNPVLPNNILAPWWTDLNLGAGGNWYLGGLTDGISTWDVLEWENVPRFGDPGSTFTFQIWLERGSSNIHFVYDGFSGNTGDGTTGAENDDGTIGDTTYFDGAGTLPWGGPDLQVASVPGTPGETHVIEFDMTGWKKGKWENCAYMTGDIFEGTAIACDSGRVR